ncbi:MAG: hypothetical protein QOK40_1230 [Miltoncostaeaceae bacterium]|nr:hypothetical protein [Miltoncostaeaceae bacterium]
MTRVVDPDRFDPDGRFRAQIAASLAQDPAPTFRRLAEQLGVPADHVVHYALCRWAAAGSEALLSGPPEVLLRLGEAAGAGDLEAVRGITAFLLAGYGPGEPDAG